MRVCVCINPIGSDGVLIQLKDILSKEVPSRQASPAQALPLFPELYTDDPITSLPDTVEFDFIEEGPGYTPLPTQESTAQGSITPAWDPSSVTSGRSTDDISAGPSIDEEYINSWLLHPKVQAVLENTQLTLRIVNSRPDFHRGEYEGNRVPMAALSKRKGRRARRGELLVFLTMLPSSLTSVPVKYLDGIPPNPGEVAIVIAGDDIGTVVTMGPNYTSDWVGEGVTQEVPPRTLTLRVWDCAIIRAPPQRR